MSESAVCVRDEMTEYWNAGFLAAEARPGAFYDLKKLPAITQASHYRRMALLDANAPGEAVALVGATGAPARPLAIVGADR